MSKSSNTKQNSYNVTAVNALHKRYGLSKQYIRQCLRGDRNNSTADTIRKDYAELVKEINQLINRQ